MVGHLDQDHLGPVDVEVLEVLRQHLGEELGERAGQLDARRPAARDHEGEGAVAGAGPVGVRLLEPAEHLAADAGGVGEGLERHRVLGHAGNAEVAAHRARGEDEIVVRDRRPAIDEHLASIEVHALHRRHAGLDVAVALHDAAGVRRDVLRREPGRGDLVEQRRERVEVVLVDDRDLDRRPRERLRRGDATEAGSDDHDVRQLHRCERYAVLAKN